MPGQWKSPFVPPPPNSTPNLASSRATLRPPIQNPYDKFTQSEFDAWIDDITGALRRALGHEDAIETTSQKQAQRVGDALLRAREEQSQTPAPGVTRVQAVEDVVEDIDQDGD